MNLHRIFAVEIVRQSFGSRLAVVWLSSGSHQELSSGSCQTVVGQSSSSCKAVAGSHQAVVRQSSGSRQSFLDPYIWYLDDELAC